jgi:hypothetical protein
VNKLKTLNVYLQGVDALWHPVVDGIIHEAMLANFAQALQLRGVDLDMKMSGPTLRTRVAGMLMAIVAY